MTEKVNETLQNDCLVFCSHKKINKIHYKLRMVISTAYQLMFLPEIHLQHDRNACDENKARKSMMILHNFGTGSILFLFRS